MAIFGRWRTTAKKRANGEGNIRKRKDGRWEGRYTAGHNPETGKAIYKNVLAKTQKECKEKLAAALEQAGKVDAHKTGQFTVGQWAEMWLGCSATAEFFLLFHAIQPALLSALALRVSFSNVCSYSDI